MKKLFSEIPCLNGERVTLRRLTLSDAQGLRELTENLASANVLRKNGFQRVLHAVPEDWGYELPTLTDKWLRTRAGYRLQYHFQT